MRIWKDGRESSTAFIFCRDFGFSFKDSRLLCAKSVSNVRSKVKTDWQIRDFKQTSLELLGASSSACLWRSAGFNLSSSSEVLR